MAENQPSNSDDFALPAPVIAALRLIGAGAIAYLFVIVLMITTAQSAAVAQLGKAAGYSVAYGEWQKAAALHKDFRPGELPEAEERAQTADLARQQASDRFSGATAALRSVMETLNGARLCRVAAPDTLNSTNVAANLDAIKSCAATNPAMPDDMKGEIGAAIESETAVKDAAKADLAARAEAQEQDNRLKRVQARMTSIANSDAAAKVQTDAFASLEVISERVPLTSWLAVLPPAMMQIVSALISGMFGALLLTLVLVVYPNSDLNFTRPGGNYGERIMLGGLIALCVLIVLGGGTAVLGTDNAFSQGTANVQAFSAIGVLAGMFSDRVAQWLSTRATSFFGDNAATGDAGNTSPAPPAPDAPALPPPASG